MKNYVIKAHKYCINNRDMLAKDSVCGCFHCIEVFSPIEIERWIKDEKETAICPYCGIDSVIGESSGFPITKDFLKEMNQYWF